MRTAQAAVPSITLHDGIEIPQLGIGVFGVPPRETQRAVELALEAGYRHIDTATTHGNEKEVGAALAASGLPREDYFVTAQLWSSQQGHDSTLMAFEASLDRLGLDHVDLYLTHWPVPAGSPFVDSWQALERIHGEEAARTIGVSNFSVEDLELLERETETRPTINQVELHLHAQRAELRAWHAEHGIATGVRNPLAQGELLDEPMIVRLAERRGKTAAQVILRWNLQLGNVVIPKSLTPEQTCANIDFFDFELSHREMAAIGDLDRSRRIGPRRATSLAS
ncbi:MAG TPA: aldo/keto reductase [Solirubrobacterales bacterium]|nr:aldo/keto reductase [Solirubrobacterales bacterium]